MDETLLRIDAPYFCAGAIYRVKHGEWVCTRAAPIIKYLVGRNSTYAKEVCKRKGWRFDVLKEGK